MNENSCDRTTVERKEDRKVILSFTVILVLIFSFSLRGVCTAQSSNTVTITTTQQTGCCVFFEASSPPCSAFLSPSLWNFGDGSSASASSDTISHCYSVTGTYAVSYSITCYWTSGNVTYTGQVSVNACSSGIFESNSKNFPLVIYPNPVTSNLYIETDDNSQTINISVFNIFGNEIMITKEKDINVSNLTEGIYFVRVKTNKGIVTKKIMIYH